MEVLGLFVFMVKVARASLGLILLMDKALSPVFIPMQHLRINQLTVGPPWRSR